MNVKTKCRFRLFLHLKELLFLGANTEFAAVINFIGPVNKTHKKRINFHHSESYAHGALCTLAESAFDTYKILMAVYTFCVFARHACCGSSPGIIRFALSLPAYIWLCVRTVICIRKHVRLCSAETSTMRESGE